MQGWLSGKPALARRGAAGLRSGSGLPRRFAPSLPLSALLLLGPLALVGGGASAPEASEAESPPPPMLAAGEPGLPVALPVPEPPALKRLDPALFPLPAEIEPNVVFWTDIFAKYRSDQVVLHDEEHPARVFAVLDFSEVEASTLSEVAKKRRREDAIRDQMGKVRASLAKLAAGEKLHDALEGEHLTALFGGAPADRREVRLAAERLRTQTGLADHFEAALERSGRYLPGMERIFTGRGLPLELTRLPFVESMFQEHARSKVAAGGMWQIMPSSGRRLLSVSHDLDERFDPFLAAEAAATILHENYRSLGTWPLAITAYNYGTNGLARAVAKLGTRDFGTIVSRHSSRVFGFASRNFYAEFWAAATLYDNRAHHFPHVVPAAELSFDEFSPDRYVSARELATRVGSDLDSLRALNPALSHEVWAGRLLVPAGYRLRVPPGQGEAFRAAYAALPAELKLARQVGGEYRVRPGDTLGAIARRHGTTVSALQQANRLGNRTMIRAGQVLRLPPGRATARAAAPARLATVAAPAGSGSAAGTAPGIPAAPAAGGGAAPAAAASLAARDTSLATPDGSASAPAGPEPAAASGSDPSGLPVAPTRIHLVRKGESLFAIARRYGTTVEALMAANGLASHRIFPGQRLAVGE